jgi:hypothetical protein
LEAASLEAARFEAVGICIVVGSVSVNADLKMNVNADPKIHSTGWSAPELALFSRAARLLSSGGLRVETDYGLTDEGEPWLVFCHIESGDVFCHFARMHDQYVACIPFRGPGLKGWQLPDVLRRFLQRQAVVRSVVTRQLMRNIDRWAAFGFALLQIA